jgi:hypothetical protein
MDIKLQMENIKQKRSFWRPGHKRDKSNKVYFKQKAYGICEMAEFFS